MRCGLKGIINNLVSEEVGKPTLETKTVCGPSSTVSYEQIEANTL